MKTLEEIEDYSEDYKNDALRSIYESTDINILVQIYNDKSQNGEIYLNNSESLTEDFDVTELLDICSSRIGEHDYDISDRYVYVSKKNSDIISFSEVNEIPDELEDEIKESIVSNKWFDKVNKSGVLPFLKDFFDEMLYDMEEEEISFDDMMNVLKEFFHDDTETLIKYLVMPSTNWYNLFGKIYSTFVDEQ